MLLGSFGLLFALTIVLLARAHLLTLRYTVGWFAVGLSIGASGALSGVVGPIADFVGLRPVELLLGISLFLLLLISVQLSITASGLIEGLRTACEDLALVEERLRRLEATSARDAEPPSTAAQQPASS